MLANLIFGSLAGLSVILLLWQWLAARKFPLHRRLPPPSRSPAVTLLKPVQGCDAATRECLRSWLTQDYAGPVQVLFGIESASDPVATLIESLKAEFPAVDARLVVCGRLAAANPKVAKLIQLESLAKGDILVISDADVHAPPDLLSNLNAGLSDPAVSLLNCFYQLANPVNAAMHWEAVAINADFWSQVLQSLTLKSMDFALGAVMAVRRTALLESGGFGVLADCLADDYQLGNRIARRGHRIALCPVVVECRDGPQTWAAVWKHQVRWARTIRVCRPLPYFLSILSNPTLWPAVWLVAKPSFPVLVIFGACLVLRVGITASLLRQLAAGEVRPVQAFIAPLKDLLQTGVWMAAFLGRRIEWRGQRFLLRRNGRLERTA